MIYEYTLDPARQQIDVIHGFLTGCYWSPGVRREVIESAIRQSVVMGAFSQPAGKQIGFARVVTDYATFAWLCDVFVLDEHRRRGVAQAMLERLFSDPRMKTLRRWCLATKDAHGLYRRYGFTPVPADRWMEMRLPAEAWQAPASGRP